MSSTTHETRRGEARQSRGPLPWHFVSAMVASIGAVVGLLGSAPAVAQDPTHQPMALLTDHGGSMAYGVDANGTIVGATRDRGKALAFRWSAEGGYEALASDDRTSMALDLNSLGQAVGILGTRLHIARPTYGNDSEVALWSHDGELTNLGTMGGIAAMGWGINDLGHVAGFRVQADGDWRGFRWSEQEGVTAIPTFGGRNSIAGAINNHGVVVGCATDAGGNWHAFAFQHETMIRLPELGGPSSCAVGINEAGDIVGTAKDAGRVARAVHWRLIGTEVSSQSIIEGPRNIPGGQAQAVNPSGEIAGDTKPGNAARAFYRGAQGATFELGTEAGRRSLALGMSPYGHIVGCTTPVTALAAYSGVVWNPVTISPQRRLWYLREQTEASEAASLEQRLPGRGNFNTLYHRLDDAEDELLDDEADEHGEVADQIEDYLDRLDDMRSHGFISAPWADLLEGIAQELIAALGAGEPAEVSGRGRGR